MIKRAEIFNVSQDLNGSKVERCGKHYAFFHELHTS